MRPEDFLEIVKRSGGQPVFRLGTIPAGYVSGRPRVQFDGESAPSARTWPYLASYTPAAGDRVLVAVVGNGGVVLGKIM
ncbi:MAG TPA: hypothetical protein GX513_08710 [Firmicutes bacterium]|nr:hypothetical protein [Bacillota bacterium]